MPAVCAAKHGHRAVLSPVPLELRRKCETLGVYTAVQGDTPVTDRAVCRPSVMPLAVATEEAAQLLGVSRSTLYDLVRQQELRPFKLGRRTLFRTADLVNWVNRQPTQRRDN